MIYIDSPSTSPYFNLALEQYVFDELPRNEDYFMLWQNDNTIVVGKYQNTIAEVNERFIRENNVNVVRRLSGGGAVYHDLGNLNFTFITEQKDGGSFDFARFCEPVVSALAAIGVTAEVSGRNDILIDGKKFSGNAQYIKHGRIMHHGTILFDSDLEMIGKALTVSKDKIESKGIKSVKSRVTNVKEYLNEEIGIDVFREKLAESILAGADSRRHELSEADLKRVEEIKADVYDQWDWNYGASPKYNLIRERRIEGCGKVEAYLIVEKGRIESVEFRGDYFGNGDIAGLQDALAGCRMEEGALHERLLDVDVHLYFNNMRKEQFIGILVGTEV